MGMPPLQQQFQLAASLLIFCGALWNFHHHHHHHHAAELPQQQQRRHLSAPSNNAANHPLQAPQMDSDVNEPQHQEKQELPSRILYIVTSVDEFDNGKRATQKGYDRFAYTLLPVLRESAWSIRQLGVWVDVVLITHYNTTDRHRQLLHDALAQPPSDLQPFSTMTPEIPWELWPDATPLTYKIKQDESRTDLLEPHYRGLSRQHRFVIKDKWQHYDLVCSFEDDMLIHGAHVQQNWQVTQQLYQLRLVAPTNNDNRASSCRRRRRSSDPNTCFYGNMSRAMLERTIPGLFRVEVALPGWKRSDYGHYQDNLYSQIPIDLQWETTRSHSNVTLDAASCCHVSNETQNDHIPHTPPATDLYFWETSINALGIRRMPDLSSSSTVASRDPATNTPPLGWVLMQVGGLDEMGFNSDAIHDYWVGSDGYFGLNARRPETLKGRYSNNQGGWMATKRQLVEWHTKQCQRGFLPPYPYDNIDKGGIKQMPRPPSNRSPMHGGFQYDGLGFESVEYWSGGQQLFGPIGCNLKRIIPLDPHQFARHLLYHSSNNKQRHGTVQHRFCSHNIQEFWGQLNTVRRNAEKVIQNNEKG